VLVKLQLSPYKKIRLKEFVGRVMRMFGPEREEVTEGWRTL
jgi:hypothetical protein